MPIGTRRRRDASPVLIFRTNHSFEAVPKFESTAPTRRDKAEEPISVTLIRANPRRSKRARHSSVLFSVPSVPSVVDSPFDPASTGCSLWLSAVDPAGAHWRSGIRMPTRARRVAHGGFTLLLLVPTFVDSPSQLRFGFGEASKSLSLIECAHERPLRPWPFLTPSAAWHALGRSTLQRIITITLSAASHCPRVSWG